MTVVDKKGRQHIVPDDLWWPLRLDVKPGESTPFHCLMWWHWQWMVPRGASA